MSLESLKGRSFSLMKAEITATENQDYGVRQTGFKFDFRLGDIDLGQPHFPEPGFLHF